MLLQRAVTTKWSYSKYTFDNPNQKIYVQDGKGTTQWTNIEYLAPNKYNEVLSLFFYARCNAMETKYVNIPTIVNDDTSHTLIHFLGERERQSVDAINYDVDCMHITGYATWKGLYGLTGKFEGWFSNDTAFRSNQGADELICRSSMDRIGKMEPPGVDTPARKQLMRILIADPIAKEGVEILRSRGFQAEEKTGLTESELLPIVGEYDAMIVRSGTTVTAPMIERMGAMKIIARAGAGVDNIDVPAATQKGILVMNDPGGNTLSAAEHTLAMMFSLARSIPFAHADMKAGNGPKSFGKASS